MASYDKDQLDIFAGKIQHVEYGMFSTIDDAGKLSSRPLTSQQVDTDGQLWFFTSDQAGFAQDLQNHAHVNVSFSEPKDKLYVSVSGRAELLWDRAKAEELWKPELGTWFPDGVNDPHLALIKVEIESAEFWDAGSSKMTQFFELHGAALNGDREQPQGAGPYRTLN